MPTFLYQFLFIVFPYNAMLVFLLGTIFRYRQAPYSYSSLSSQFLEIRRHFWALVPFHFGIIAVAPFIRLVHILAVPNPYLWRRPQVVCWCRAPREAA